MARFTEQFKTNGKFDYKKLMEHRPTAQLDQLTEEPDSEQFTQEVKAAQEKAEGKGKKAEVAKPAVQAVKNEEIQVFDADAINGVTVETIIENKIEKSRGVWKTIKTLRKEATELMQETEMTPKQKNVAKVAGDPHKIDGADLAALRGKKKMEEGQADYILKKHTGGEKKKSVSAKEMSDFKDSLTSFIQTKKMPVNLDKK